MKIDGPRQAVFQTAELLEMILLNLTVVNIFGVQRVCRQFRDAVASSTAIQQKLFLKPSDAEQQSWVVKSRPAQPGSGNPWPEPYFVTVDPSISQAADRNPVTPARLNPL